MNAVRWFLRELFQELDLERETALAALAWGVWVIALDSFDSSPAFIYLVRSAAWLTGAARAEWFWGGLCVIAGSLQLCGIFSDRRGLRMGVAFFSATLWTCLATAFALHNPVGTGALVYAFFAYRNAALYYQVGTGKRGFRGRFNVRVTLPANLLPPGGTQP